MHRQQELMRRAPEAMLPNNLCRWCGRCRNERPQQFKFCQTRTLTLPGARPHAIALGRDNLRLVPKMYRETTTPPRPHHTARETMGQARTLSLLGVDARCRADDYCSGCLRVPVRASLRRSQTASTVASADPSFMRKFHPSKAFL